MKYYTFKLSYEKSFVRVSVIEKTTLADLAQLLLEAIDFELDHAFGFHSNLKNPYHHYMDKQFTLFSDHGEAESEADTGVKKTKVSSVFEEGEAMLFHFDYGEDWRFIVKCESIEKLKSEKGIIKLRKNKEVLEIQGEFPEQYPEYDEDEEL